MIEQQLTVDAPRDTVWRAFTEPERIREWFGWDYDGLDAEIAWIVGDANLAAAPDRISHSDGSYIELAGESGQTTIKVAFPDSVEVEEGWRTFLAQLRFLLETAPRGRRRTVYLTGEAAGPAVAALAEGRPWHDAPRQRSAVDTAGHLVVVTANAGLTSEDTGPVSVLVTTYGLDDAAFDELRQRWGARWQALVKNPEVTT
ncbi:SRPBCC family protein [Phytohabitans rumicis]|uniref:Activator of HSP90 ATPase n=1 Tax=Phytohabitans rumicis TaxID=1076125 RepID=A0A6V8L6Y0_9ACTN|nr:SRPBCC domain-containing protein [Phytohabitans rumicis]GFJ93012.1 hypothetical protein Prum_066540 [Phytohabitans rumicis]